MAFGTAHGHLPDSWAEPFARDELAGRVCLVTGAAQGIGATIAATLAQHGGRVVVTDVDLAGAEAQAARLRSAGADAIARALDVTDTEQIDAVLTAVEQHWGPLDVLVNNAGLCVVRPTAEVTDREWQMHMDVMLTGPFKLCRRVAPSMLQRNRGAIVNVCSIGGFGGWPQRTAYNTAKGGLRLLTKLLAVEWAPHGVRVNGIAPSVVRTEIMDDVIARSDGTIMLDDYEGRTPMGRVAEPREMADGVLFLVSDHAAHVTGHTLAIDGGWLASDGFPTERGEPGHE